MGSETIRNRQYGADCQTSRKEMTRVLKPFDLQALSIFLCIKVALVTDPAVGSGAFPLGMLNEIVKARSTITNYICIPLDYATRRTIHIADRSTHRLKLEAVRDSIFAADIEPSAVDIARLRLWLSLVIDDELVDDPIFGHTDPLPLPNLECNIVCGNSLLDTLDGIRLINQSELLGTEQQGAQINFLEDSFNATVRKLIEKQQELFSCEDTEKKQQLLERIESLRDAIIRIQLEGASPEIMAHYEEARTAASKPYVLWQLEFARVFREKGGFDVCMGNPPYIQLQKKINEETGEKLGDQYSSLGFETFAKTGDIYCLFYEKGFRLLRDNGILAFITSNKWMRAGYGEKLRAFFAKKTNPLSLIDFASQKIFESATVDVNILIFAKEQNAAHTIACIAKENCTGNLSVYFRREAEVTAFVSSDSWVIMNTFEASIKRKMEERGVPLREWKVSINRGILTGLNDAFIISGSVKDQLISEDPRSAEIIRPILRGRDVKRYHYDFADLWLIASHNGIKERGVEPIHVEDYPAIQAHLDQFGDKLAERADKGDTPYNLRNCAYMDDFSKPKIVWGNLCLSAQFAYVEDDCYINAPSPMIVPGNKYLLAILNSRIADWYIRQLGVTRNGGYFEYKPMFVEQLPIPIVDDLAQAPFIEATDKVLAGKCDGQDTSYVEKEIDQMAYMLYGLSHEEIRFIEEYGVE